MVPGEKSKNSLWVNMAKLQLGMNEEKKISSKRRKQIVKIMAKRNPVHPRLRGMMSGRGFWSQLRESQDRLWQKPPQRLRPTLQHWPGPVVAFSEHVRATKQP